MTKSGETFAEKLGASVADKAGVRRRIEETLYLNTLRVEPDPNQPRKKFNKEALDALAESLSKHGQLQPILVRHEKGRYIIVAGERRWRAAKMAGIATIQARVFNGSDVRSVQLVENLLREDLRPIEQAKAYKELMDTENWSARELARQLSIEHTSVARALKLLTLPSNVQDAVNAGTIPPTSAYQIARRPSDQQESLAQKAVSGEIKGEDLRRPPSPPPTAKPLPELTIGAPKRNSWLFGSGRASVEVSGHRDLAEMISTLEKALKAAKSGKPSLAGGR